MRDLHRVRDAVSPGARSPPRRLHYQRQDDNYSSPPADSTPIDDPPDSQSPVTATMAVSAAAAEEGAQGVAPTAATGTDSGTASETGSPTPGPSGSLSSSDGSPTSSGNSSMSASQRSASGLYPSGNSSSTSTDTASSSTATTSSKSKHWTYTPTASMTTSGRGAAATTYVPGIIFNMSMSLPSDSEAIYSVPMTFGHDPSGATDYRRAPSGSGSVQVMNMLVDLGSSDMWVASSECNTPVCKSAPALFDASLSDDSGVPQSLTYHSGSVTGDIHWEQVVLGSFGIGYQALVVGDSIYNENLGPGNFSGLLGLALPANSLITQTIPGTTGSSADGATFLDNLFGAGASAPSQRYFSLSLQRPQDVRTYSTFGIGEIFKPVCPDSSKLSYVPIEPNPRYGRTGYLHWRVLIDAIKCTTFGNVEEGTQPSVTSIPLGRSGTNSNTTTPLAVLDSGGLPILISNKTLIDSIYGAFGIKVSGDGVYRMPCTTQLAVSLTIGGVDYPIHPLDMTWPDKDLDTSNCVGGMQYAPTVGDAGDIILGSAFLKNVYSVFQYPDQRTSPWPWQPTVGLLSLTDAAAASRDFYAVRTERRSLQEVSSGQSSSSGNNSPSAAVAQDAAQHKAVSLAVIIGCSVVGFIVFVALAFCAWWFLLRRKLGAAGQVDYKTSSSTTPDASTDTLRSRKHQETKRQKSMVEGYSDFEEDSWRSEHTEKTMADSVGLSDVPEAHEEGDAHRTPSWDMGTALPNHRRGQSLHQGLLNDNGSPQSMHEALPDISPPEAVYSPEQRGRLAPGTGVGPMAQADRDRRSSRTSRANSRGSSKGSGSVSWMAEPAPPLPSQPPQQAGQSPPSQPSPPGPPPGPPPIDFSRPRMPTRSPSISMAGPFPAVTRGSLGGGEYDYFPVLPAASAQGNVNGGGGGGGSRSQSRPPSAPRLSRHMS